MEYALCEFGMRSVMTEMFLLFGHLDIEKHVKPCVIFWS